MTRLTSPAANSRLWKGARFVLVACLLAGAAFTGLGGIARAQRAPATPSRSKPPDLILITGVIYTGDPSRPRVEAVAISGERIVAVGSSKEIHALAGPKTRIVDLGGRFAMPGFNDAHIHLASGGQAKLKIDFKGAKSLAEFQQRIRARLADHKPGEWITGQGWDHTLWPEQKFPTRAELDAVSRRHSMLFTRIDGHVAVANSLGFEKAGISRDTPDPPGGSIERDASGEPTGMLKENAVALVSRQVPPLSDRKSVV